MGRICFLILSDIHFHRERAGGVYEADADVRSQLLLDIEGQVKEVGPIYGVLLTGDIAFAGATQEYAFAVRWLQQVCAAARCPTDHVWVVPGNHDVDRSTVDADPLLQAAHTELRKIAAYDIDAVLAKWLQSRHKEPLFQPIAQYNDFAAAFGCDISADTPVWRHAVELNDGSQLCIVGLNSTFCSDGLDDERSDCTKVVLGTVQATAITPRPDTVAMSLCHHPIHWLRDCEEVQWVMLERYRIQIFGHTHLQRPYVKNGSLIVSCGALHPDRHERGWAPTYNILTLWVDGRAAARRLVTELRTRVWHADHRFVPHLSAKGEHVITHSLELPRWEGRDEVSLAPDDAPAPEPMNSSPVSERQPVRSEMDRNRRLAYRFLTLPHHDRIAIATELGLVRDEDEGARDRELFARYFRRASDQGLVEALWDLVAARRTWQDDGPNPFATQ